MTTVAWDGTTLAGDKRAVWGDSIPVEATKVFRVKHKKEVYLIGFSGLTAVGEAFVRHLRKKGLVGHPPGVKGSTIWVITRRGGLILSDDDPRSEHNEEKWAIGSGWHFALGAMYSGKTAEQAVEIASRLDIYTGGGVDAVRF